MVSTSMSEKRVDRARRAPKPRVKAKRPSKRTARVRKPKVVAEVRKPEKDINRLLALRTQISARRPKFVRQESWRYGRLHENWRYPRGIDSKMRLRVKGWPKTVNVGYRGPKVVRDLHPSGLRAVLVNTHEDMEKLNPKSDAVRFASTLGRRKRITLFSRAKELGLRVLNPRRVTPLPKTEEA